MPFPFFKLPRELRDIIYEQIGGTSPNHYQPPSSQDPIWSLGLSCYPRSHLLRVSKAFSREYQECESFAKATVVIDCDLAVWLEQPHIIKTRIKPLQEAMCRLEKVGVIVHPSLTWGQAQEQQIERMLRSVCESFPRIKNVHIKAHVPLSRFERNCLARRFDTGLFFDKKRRASLDLDDGLDVKRSLLITSKLCSAVRCLQAVDSCWEMLPECNSFVESDFMNRVTYRAKPSARCDAWLGLDLMTDSVGAFDYDQILAELERGAEIRRAHRNYQ